MSTRSARVAIAAGALAAGGLALTTFAWTTNTVELAAGAPTTRSYFPADGRHDDVSVREREPSGHTLFLSQGCATCHDGPESRALAEVAPSLSDAPSWAGDRRPGLSAEAYLRESIRTPGAFISPAFTHDGPTTAMPGFTLTDVEIAALVAYLLAPS